MQNFKSVMSCIFILAGGFGLATAGLSLLNPMGTARKEPGDPFGTSVPLEDAILLICFYVFLVITGTWLAISVRRKRESR
jgi:hypothetical protein